ncbi:MAG: hypothetical protein ABI707_05855 [Ferruginibacter sp.]
MDNPIDFYYYLQRITNIFNPRKNTQDKLEPSYRKHDPHHGDHTNNYNLTAQKIYGSKNIWILIPTFGIISFMVTYVIAAFLYPGGSQADPASTGFSWMHNYWCNLLNEKAMNGEYNTAMPFAICGMFILCLSLAIFWYRFAQMVKFRKPAQKIIQFSGIISTCTGFFLFTRYHDMVINISGLLAIFAVAGTFTGLYKMGWQKLFWLGIFNLVLIGINNFIYYSNEFIAWLPVVQKITFLLFLFWISLIDISLYKLTGPKQINIKVNSGNSGS